MAAADFVFDLDAGAVADLADSPEAEAMLQEVGDVVATTAQGNARSAGPGGLYLTGDGIASIAVLVDRDGGLHADVSWGADEFYMGFAELGTEHQPATPFLRPALDATRI